MRSARSVGSMPIPRPTSAGRWRQSVFCAPGRGILLAGGAGFAPKGMLEAVRVVRAPLANLLNDEQKTRFNAVPSGEDQNEPERRRNLSVLCSERAWGISSVPI
jgi:hypothetical protein